MWQKGGVIAENGVPVALRARAGTGFALQLRAVPYSLSPCMPRDRPLVLPCSTTSVNFNILLVKKKMEKYTHV